MNLSSSQALLDGQSIPATNEKNIINEETYHEKETTSIVSVANEGTHLTIQFNNKIDDDNHNRYSTVNNNATYHASWLYSNDPKHVLLPSGQRTVTPGRYVTNSRPPKIMNASIVYCNIESRNDSEPTLGSEGGGDKLVMDKVPGPTMKDCCHPLAVYGGYPPWVSISKVAESTQQTNSIRPYLKVVWSGPTVSSSNLQQQQQMSHDDLLPTSIYDIEWLQRFQYNDSSNHKRRNTSEIKPIHAIRKDGPPLWYAQKNQEEEIITTKHDENDGLVHVNYQSIIGNDDEIIQDGLFQLLHAVFRDGAAIVSNTPIPSSSSTIETLPENDLPVSKVAKAMSGGELSHGSLYGNIFHVRVGERNANNVAYTSTALCPHQDMAYYESPPGMQLLHCVANGSGVIGGESTLADALAAAYQLREVRPESFECLVQCPVTFVKQRDGACMTYRRPHIVLDGGSWCGNTSKNDMFDREITAVFWSPPFEGPTYLPPGQVDKYYKAYADFERILNGSSGTSDDGNDLDRYANEFTWEHKLNPGEMLVFNNRRMVHGRRSFSSAEGVSFEESQRHLVGCYTNIDDTLNSYRVLLREKGFASATPTLLNVGNGTTSFP